MQAGGKSYFKGVLNALAQLNDQLWKPVLGGPPGPLPIIAKMCEDAVIRQLRKLMNRRLADFECGPLLLT